MSLVHGDCIDVMAAMDPESFDAVVTDPPYGLEFMGKEWDRLTMVPDRGPGPRGRNPYGGWHGTSGADPLAQQEWHARWAEAAYRVAKPSAYLLAFGGTRTVHRMTVALEDAGWIIRDMLVWAYASGFPKSKASLKPAWEPIVMARKPGPLRMLAIDECRIPMAEGDAAIGGAQSANGRGEAVNYGAGGYDGTLSVNTVGRWPANVILTDPIFDGDVEGVVGGGETTPTQRSRTNPDALSANGAGVFGVANRQKNGPEYFGDSGTYSRFFLIPKADRAEREPVLGGLPQEVRTMNSGLTGVSGDRSGRGGKAEPLEMGASTRANTHPTVKPVDLMRHLVRLVTPTGGIVLDPFLGSGTTGIACEMEGFGWVGIEKEAEYVAIAEARLNGVQRGLGLEAS